MKPDLSLRNRYSERRLVVAWLTADVVKLTRLGRIAATRNAHAARVELVAIRVNLIHHSAICVRIVVEVQGLANSNSEAVCSGFAIVDTLSDAERAWFTSRFDIGVL